MLSRVTSRKTYGYPSMFMCFFGIEFVQRISTDNSLYINSLYINDCFINHIIN